jgi:nucleotide-binding universal stress UspA family protein
MGELDMTFRRILVALDRSFQASFIFTRALEQAKPQHCQLLILHTLRVEADLQRHTSADLRHLTDVSDLYATLRKLHQKRIQQELEKAQQWLEFYRQAANARGIEAIAESRVGDAGSLICDCAHRWHADLIVLGRRDYQGVKDMALGSVSSYVTQHAPCSVLLARARVSSQIAPAIPKSPAVANQFATSVHR